MQWSAAGAELQARALCRPSRSPRHLGLSRPFARKNGVHFFDKQSQLLVKNKRYKYDSSISLVDSRNLSLSYAFHSTCLLKRVPFLDTNISLKMSFLDKLLLKGPQIKCNGAPQARNCRRGRSGAPCAPRGTWGSAGTLRVKMGSTFLKNNHKCG